jgi:type II restriction enzyme
MAPLERTERVRKLAAALPGLSDSLLAWIETVVEQMARPHAYTRLPTSDLFDDRFLNDFGDTLQLHHCFSNEPFTKDKFEYAMEWVANVCGHEAKLSTRGNPGHDITIDGTPISLKTEGAKNIREAEIHISKFMELGKGAWGTSLADLHGLRAQFLEHMSAYDRIFTLRHLPGSSADRRYELVEIPKALLKKAAWGEFTMMDKSKQMPRPGYCRVSNSTGALLFELYFDGGTERKLQVRHLRKDACVVHADWRFAR